MRNKLVHMALCLIFAIGLFPLAGADYEGAATPDELYTYIRELYSRKFDETLLPQTESFLRRYPSHDYAESVQQIRIAVLNRLGNHRDTAEAIDEYLRQYPESPQREEFLRVLGACRFQLKDYPRAAACYRDLAASAAREEAREEAQLSLAKCENLLKNPAGEQKLLKALAEAPLKNGHDARLGARLLYAPILQNEGDYQGALQIYQELVDYPKVPANLRPTLLYNAATLAYRLADDLGHAERLYSTLLVESPRSDLAAPALRQLCLCKFQLRKYEEFLELAARYRQQNPQAADRQLDMDTVEALMALKRHEEALPWLQRLIQAADTPEEVLRRARYYEFCALVETGQTEAALSRGDSYLEEYPNSIYKTYLLAQLAECAWQSRAYARARQYLEALLPLVETNREATEQYGRQLAKLYVNDQLWLPATEWLEKLAAGQADAAERAKLLLEASETAARIPDFPRAKAILEQLRKESLQANPTTYLAASELLYRLSAQNNQGETAFQVARETLEKSTGRDRTVWLTRLGNHFLTNRQYEQAADCYAQALAIPELPPESRRQLLPAQLQLLLTLGRAEALFALLPELFQQNLPLPAKTGEELANFCTANGRRDFAKTAWRRLLENSDADEAMRLRAELRLAEAELATGEAAKAKSRLQEIIASHERKELAAPADAYAMLAEFHLLNHEYDLALMNVDRALEKERQAIFTTRTATRAWYVKARFLYEKQHDREAAKATASLAGLLKTDEEYSPLALELIAQILREEGQAEQAAAEEERIRQKFPKFKPATAPAK